MLEINEKFKKLLPELETDEFRELEASILQEGCRTKILIWNGQIVDGHNRFEICQKNKIDYEVEELLLSDEDAVIEWIIRNQLGRRNLTDTQKHLYIGQLYEMRMKAVGAPVGNKNAIKSQDELPPNSKKQDQVRTMSTLNLEPKKTTAEIIAEEFKINEKTVRRDAKMAQAFQKSDKETKERFLNKKITKKDLVKSAEANNSIQIAAPTKVQGTFRCAVDRFNLRPKTVSVSFEVVCFGGTGCFCSVVCC